MWFTVWLEKMKEKSANCVPRVPVEGPVLFVPKDKCIYMQIKEKKMLVYCRLKCTSQCV